MKNKQQIQWQSPILGQQTIRLRPMGWLNDMLPLRPPSLWRGYGPVRGLSWSPSLPELSWLFAAYSMLGVEMPLPRIEHRSHTRIQHGRSNFLRRKTAQKRKLTIPNWTRETPLRTIIRDDFTPIHKIQHKKRIEVSDFSHKQQNVPQFQWKQNTRGFQPPSISQTFLEKPSDSSVVEKPIRPIKEQISEHTVLQKKSKIHRKVLDIQKPSVLHFPNKITSIQVNDSSNILLRSNVPVHRKKPLEDNQFPSVSNKTKQNIREDITSRISSSTSNIETSFEKKGRLTKSEGLIHPNIQKITSKGVVKHSVTGQTKNNEQSVSSELPRITPKVWQRTKQFIVPKQVFENPLRPLIPLKNEENISNDPILSPRQHRDKAGSKSISKTKKQQMTLVEKTKGLITKENTAETLSKSPKIIQQSSNKSRIKTKSEKASVPSKPLPPKITWKRGSHIGSIWTLQKRQNIKTDKSFAIFNQIQSAPVTITKNIDDVKPDHIQRKSIDTQINTKSANIILQKPTPRRKQPKNKQPVESTIGIEPTANKISISTVTEKDKSRATDVSVFIPRRIPWRLRHSDTTISAPKSIQSYSVTKKSNPNFRTHLKPLESPIVNTTSNQISLAHTIQKQSNLNKSTESRIDHKVKSTEPVELSVEPRKIQHILWPNNRINKSFQLKDGRISTIQWPTVQPKSSIKNEGISFLRMEFKSTPIVVIPSIPSQQDPPQFVGKIETTTRELIQTKVPSKKTISNKETLSVVAWPLQKRRSLLKHFASKRPTSNRTISNIAQKQDRLVISTDNSTSIRQNFFSAPIRSNNSSRQVQLSPIIANSLIFPTPNIPIEVVHTNKSTNQPEITNILPKTTEISIDKTESNDVFINKHIKSENSVSQNTKSKENISSSENRNTKKIITTNVISKKSFKKYPASYVSKNSGYRRIFTSPGMRSIFRSNPLLKEIIEEFNIQPAAIQKATKEITSSLASIQWINSPIIEVSHVLKSSSNEVVSTSNVSNLNRDSAVFWTRNIDRTTPIIANKTLLIKPVIQNDIQQSTNQTNRSYNKPSKNQKQNIADILWRPTKLTVKRSIVSIDTSTDSTTPKRQQETTKNLFSKSKRSDEFQSKDITLRNNIIVEANTSKHKSSQLIHKIVIPSWNTPTVFSNPFQSKAGAQSFVSSQSLTSSLVYKPEVPGIDIQKTILPIENSIEVPNTTTKQSKVSIDADSNIITKLPNIKAERNQTVGKYPPNKNVKRRSRGYLRADITIPSHAISSVFSSIIQPEMKSGTVSMLRRSQLQFATPTSVDDSETNPDQIQISKEKNEARKVSEKSRITSTDRTIKEISKTVITSTSRSDNRWRLRKSLQKIKGIKDLSNPERKELHQQIVKRFTKFRTVQHQTFLRPNIDTATLLEPTNKSLQRIPQTSESKAVNIPKKTDKNTHHQKGFNQILSTLHRLVLSLPESNATNTTSRKYSFAKKYNSRSKSVSKYTRTRTPQLLHSKPIVSRETPTTLPIKIVAPQGIDNPILSKVHTDEVSNPEKNLKNNSTNSTTLQIPLPKRLGRGHSPFVKRKNISNNHTTTTYASNVEQQFIEDLPEVVDTSMSKPNTPQDITQPKVWKRKSGKLGKPISPRFLGKSSSTGILLKKSSTEISQQPVVDAPVPQKPNEIDNNSDAFMIDATGNLLTGIEAKKKLVEMGYKKVKPPSEPNSSSSNSFTWEAPKEAMQEIVKQTSMMQQESRHTVVKRKQNRVVRQRSLTELTEEQLFTILEELSSSSPQAQELLREVQMRVEEYFDFEKFRKI
jgi:hypothetical protein